MALPWGDARTQFQLVRVHVETEIGRGVPKRRIFEALLKEGKISMAEKTFYKHADKALKYGPKLTLGGVTAPTHQSRQEQRVSPTSGPLLTSQSEGKGRFQMADEIPNYD